MTRLLLPLYYGLLYFVHFRLYGPVHDLYWRFRYGRTPRDLGLALCQTFAKAGHIERYCPNAKASGLLYND